MDKDNGDILATVNDKQSIGDGWDVAGEACDACREWSPDSVTGSTPDTSSVTTGAVSSICTTSVDFSVVADCDCCIAVVEVSWATVVTSDGRGRVMDGRPITLESCILRRKSRVVSRSAAPTFMLIPNKNVSNYYHDK